MLLCLITQSKVTEVSLCLHVEVTPAFMDIQEKGEGGQEIGKG